MRCFGGLLLLAGLAVLAADAQVSGRVTGSVVDASGAATPSAVVSLYLSGGLRPLLSVKTTNGGLYSFMGVRPGDYDLTVAATGFVTATVRGISVDPARETLSLIHI